MRLARGKLEHRWAKPKYGWANRNMAGIWPTPGGIIVPEGFFLGFLPNDPIPAGGGKW